MHSPHPTSPAPLSPTRRLSSPQSTPVTTSLSATIQQQLRTLDFYTTILLNLRTDTLALLTSLDQSAALLESIAVTLGTGLVDTDSSSTSDLDDLPDSDLDSQLSTYTTGVRRIQSARLADLRTDLTATVIGPVHQTIHLNAVVEMRLKERTELTTTIEQLSSRNNPQALIDEWTDRLTSLNSSLTVELSEHITARTDTLARAFTHLRAAQCVFFNSAGRCISDHKDAYGNLPVEGESMAIQTAENVTDAIFEELVLVAVAVTAAEQNATDPDDPVLLDTTLPTSPLPSSSSSSNTSNSKKKWRAMKDKIMNTSHTLTRKLSRSSSNLDASTAGRISPMKPAPSSSKADMGFMKVYVLRASV